jgi:hypothetical protein
MAGLQLIRPIAVRLIVTNMVGTPMRADAHAASAPA